MKRKKCGKKKKKAGLKTPGVPDDTVVPKDF